MDYGDEELRNTVLWDGPAVGDTRQYIEDGRAILIVSRCTVCGIELNPVVVTDTYH